MFMAAMAPELKVSLMARIVSPPAGGDRLFTLQNSRSPDHRRGAKWIGGLDSCIVILGKVGLAGAKFSQPAGGI